MRFFAWAAVLLSTALQDSKGPTPQKEHQLLKQFEGEWGTVTQATTEPGQPPVEGKGQETARMVLGGFWLYVVSWSKVQDKFFEGHGSIGYDPLKRKYTATWTENTSPYLRIAEGEADAAGKSLTLTSESIDPKTRKPFQAKWVFTFGEFDTRTTVYSRIEPDGKETKLSETVYTRK